MSTPEALLRTISVHECGHMLAMFHFRIPAVPLIDVADDGSITGGRCFQQFSGNSEKDSVICYCGVTAEDLMDCPHPSRTPIPWKPSATSIEEWSMAVLYYLKELSDTDREGISGYFDPQKSARFAVEILYPQRERLDKLARELADFARAESDAKAAAYIARLSGRSAGASTAQRAAILTQLLSTMPPDHPMRQAYEKALEYLVRGEAPPATLFETSAQCAQATHQGASPASIPENQL